MRKSPAFFAGVAACLTLTALAFVACGDDNSSSKTTAVTSAPTDSATSAGNSSPAVTTKPAATTAAPTGAIEACKLLSKDEAAAALGNATDVADPRSDTAPPVNGTIVSTCSYFSPKAGSASVLLRKSDANTAGAAYDGIRKAAANGVDVPGVGQKAFYAPTLGQLNILVKDTVLIVTLGPVGTRPPTPTADLVALGKKIAAKI